MTIQKKILEEIPSEIIITNLSQGTGTLLSWPLLGDNNDPAAF